MTLQLILNVKSHSEENMFNIFFKYFQIIYELDHSVNIIKTISFYGKKAHFHLEDHPS